MRTAGSESERAEPDESKQRLRTYDRVIVRQDGEDAEVDGVCSGEDERQADDGSHPVPSSLAEREDESARGENESADEGRVKSCFGAAPGDVSSIEPFLVEVGTEADDGCDSAGKRRVSDIFR